MTSLKTTSCAVPVHLSSLLQAEEGHIRPSCLNWPLTFLWRLTRGVTTPTGLIIIVKPPAPNSLIMTTPRVDVAWYHLQPGSERWQRAGGGGSCETLNGKSIRRQKEDQCHDADCCTLKTCNKLNVSIQHQKPKSRDLQLPKNQQCRGRQQRRLLTISCYCWTSVHQRRPRLSLTDESVSVTLFF